VGAKHGGQASLPKAIMGLPPRAASRPSSATTPFRDGGHRNRFADQLNNMHQEEQGALNMTERPTIHQPQVIADHPTAGSWSRFKELAARTDFQLVVAFSLIGLLITLNLVTRFPEFGAVIAQYNQF
jgi:hypothetical protein